MRDIMRIALLAMVITLAGCGSNPEVVSNNVAGTAATPVAPTTPPATLTAQPTATFVATPTTAPATPSSAPPTETVQAATATTTAEATATTTGEATATPAGAASIVTPVPTAATTPDGIAIRPELKGTIAFTREGNIFVYEPQTGVVKLLIENGRDVQYSRDGSQIAFVRDDGLYLAAADGSNVQRIAAQPNVSDPRWTDDGSKIAFQRVVDAAAPGRGEIWTIELPNGQPIKITNGGDPAWAPDSKRLAYITEPTGDPRRNQLRLTNWLGQNDWGVVKNLPADTPSIGIPGEKVSPSRLEHMLLAPVWDAEGRFIYVPSFVLYQALSDFTIFERADAINGDSTFLGELPSVIDALGSPNRQAVVFSTSTARGDIGLVGRPLNTEADPEQYIWATTQDGNVYPAVAWAPTSDALVSIRCLFEDQNRCDLVLLAPNLNEPAVLIPDVFAGKGVDYQNRPALTWGGASQ